MCIYKTQDRTALSKFNRRHFNRTVSAVMRSAVPNKYPRTVLFCFNQEEEMSLLQSIFDMKRSRRRQEQRITPARRPEETQRRPPRSSSQEYYSPVEQAANVPSFTRHEILKPDIPKFQINLDVQYFTPNEISVKITDGDIIIEGYHDEKQDELGWISRKFTRRCPIPLGCNHDAIESHLSADGILTVTVPLKRSQTTNEHTAPIIVADPIETKAIDCKIDDNSTGNQ